MAEWTVQARIHLYKELKLFFCRFVLSCCCLIGQKTQSFCFFFQVKGDLQALSGSYGWSLFTQTQRGKSRGTNTYNKKHSGSQSQSCVCGESARDKKKNECVVEILYAILWKESKQNCSSAQCNGKKSNLLHESLWKCLEKLPPLKDLMWNKEGSFWESPGFQMLKLKQKSRTVIFRQGGVHGFSEDFRNTARPIPLFLSVDEVWHLKHGYF